MNQIDELKKEIEYLKELIRVKKEIEYLKELIRVKDELIAELKEAKKYAVYPCYPPPYTIEVTW